MDLKSYIRHVPDFPKPGILFYDISTLLADAAAWRETVRRLGERIAAHRFAPGARVRQQSGDVVEQDSRFREVGDVPYV